MPTKQWYGAYSVECVSCVTVNREEYRIGTLNNALNQKSYGHTCEVEQSSPVPLLRRGVGRKYLALFSRISCLSKCHSNDPSPTTPRIHRLHILCLHGSLCFVCRGKLNISIL